MLKLKSYYVLHRHTKIIVSQPYIYSSKLYRSNK